MHWNPVEDGITHINIYSKGLTELGRFLSNWTKEPLVTLDGPFLSVEGYWAWLGYSFPAPDTLRKMYGFAAKSMILDEPEVVRPDFQSRICYALEYKCRHMPNHLLAEFLQSELPFTHYYVYGGKGKHAGFEWIVEEITRLRKEIKNESYIRV